MVFRAATRSSTTNSSVSKTVVWPPRHFTDRKIETWTADDVGEWLDMLDLGTYRNMFSKHGVTGQILAKAHDQELENFGISVPLHRVKLEREIRKINK